MLKSNRPRKNGRPLHLEGTEWELPWVRSGDYGKWAPKRRPLVLVNGCFDLLHSGHLYLLAAARRRAGDEGSVLVSLDSDAMIVKKKGRPPILTWVERAVQLQWCGMVDLVHECVSDEDFKELARRWMPDVRVRSQEYRMHPRRIPTPQLFVPDLVGIRSSEIVRRVLERERAT